MNDRNSHSLFPRLLLHVAEALTLLIILLAFWYHAPPRLDYLPLLWLAVPIFWLRWRIEQRIVTPHPLQDGLVVFILLMVLNYEFAPYQRSSFLVVTARPLLGIWIVVYMVEYVRTWRDLRGLQVATLGIGAVLAFFALTTSNWSEKSAVLMPIIDLVPRFDYRSGPVWLADMLLSFNVNEVAGAIIWVLPFAAALLFLPISKQTGGWQRWYSTGLAIGAGVVANALFLALFFGQSRAAIGGFILSMSFVLVLLIRERRRQAIGFALLGCLLIVEAGLIWHLNRLDAEAPARDVGSTVARLAIYQATLEMIQDEPFTGVGMSMWRAATGASGPYVVTDVRDKRIYMPHAHNELLQIGADLGIPGILWWVWLHATVAIILRRAWQTDDIVVCITAIAVGAGFIGHGVYGLADTIALWDRFHFLFWWFIGLSAALHVRTQQVQLENIMTDSE